MTNKEWFRVGLIKMPTHQWYQGVQDRAGNIKRCSRCGVRVAENSSTLWQASKGKKWMDIKEYSIPSCVGPLETPENNLGLAVEGCKKSPNKKHMPSMSTVAGHILDPGKETELYVIDANCVYCGLPGSRTINPYSFNWD